MLQRGIDVALGTPGVTAFCTPGEISILPDVLAAASSTKMLDDAERAEVIAAAMEEPLIFPIPV